MGPLCYNSIKPIQVIRLGALRYFNLTFVFANVHVTMICRLPYETL